MPVTIKPLDTAKFIEKYWFEKTGLFTTLIIITIIEVSLTIFAKAKWQLVLIIPIFSILLIIFIWFISCRPPKTPKGKIGFLVSIYCADNLESEKLYEDFVIPLQRLVKGGKAGKVFHFMELPQRLAKSIIEPDDALTLRIKSRAHFMIFGRVRLRKIEKKEYHVIDLEGLVAHKPIPKPIKLDLEKEFSELLPKKIQIETENDLLSFQFTSEWTSIVAKYIIGIAAAYSGDLNYAETLYVDALNEVKNQNATFPIFSKLNKRIPIRISELYETRVFASYEAWVKSHNFEYIDEMGNFLQKVEDSRKENPNIVNLSAIYLFLKEHDADKAITLLNKAKKDDDGVWHYNLAFLYSYKGDLKAAIRHYRKAITLEVEPRIIANIEEFILWILQQEPKKYQLYYSLGFFNWKAKGDKAQAQKDFGRFLKAADKNQFSKEIELANKWIDEIKKTRK